jgi:hypothetical protein
MPIIGRFGSLAGLGSLILPGGAMESIATVTVGSGGVSSLTLSDIPSGFQHLQLRWIARGTRSAASESLVMRFNDATTNHWQYHQLYGDGATAGALSAAGPGSNILFGDSTAATATASVFGAGITDILDYGSTSKNKTVRTFQGFDRNGAGTLSIQSGAWFNTAAITKILIFGVNANLAEFSTFALYGLRAP